MASVVLSAGCDLGRATAAEIDRLVEVLQIERGAVVADVGAGDGEWAVQLAARVGEEGHVWATEVDEDEVENIEDRILGAFLNNVTVVRGNQSDSGLPTACCDAILLRMVYHHFVRPEEMRTSLRRAVRPGGRIAIVDISPQSSWRDLPGVPDRGGHGIPLADLILEMTAAGFEVDESQEEWNGDKDRYCVVFKR